MGWMWVVWIAVIVVIVLLVRASAASERGGGEARETPEEILRRRYAKGEIDKDEYDRILSDLRR